MMATEKTDKIIEFLFAVDTTRTSTLVDLPFLRQQQRKKKTQKGLLSDSFCDVDVDRPLSKTYRASRSNPKTALSSRRNGTL